ncbi:ParA family protein [Massilia sp. BJB1822]|uniref:ParA family protein n=1 Tax=Massilia sp. BJB1822 TaxID=2744470 RepID=UPI001592E9ED|nr:AAA family ATPase [Massilia sp. BJB1822]NVD99954.1 ParA family protein [Massilia sp. BJB1822]
MPKQTAHIITLLSGTGGSGKTSISLEIGRVLALEGKRTMIITNGAGFVPERFTFENPTILSEMNVQLHPSETSELREELIRKKVLDAAGHLLVSGIDYFIAAGELHRLKNKETSEAQLERLASDFDVIILDDAVELETALALSNLIVVIFDAQHWAAYLSARARYGETLEKNWEPTGLPKIRSLLVNVDDEDEGGWGIHNRLADFGLPAFHTVLTCAHRHARTKVGHAFAPNEKYHLLLDAAPDSISAFEYRSLAREVMLALT